MPEGQRSFAVYADKEIDDNMAKQVAEKLNLERLQDWEEAKEKDLLLKIDKNGVSLVSDKMELRGDFTQMLPRIKTNNLQGELLVKAAKIKSFGENPTAIDATAGMGEDSFLLATTGFSVKLYEYNPVIALLLQDALNRAAKVPELKEIVGRMELFEEDSIQALQNLSEKPDLILLDPMFPARQKSALIKKKFQILQKLESPCMDGDALIRAATLANPRKIIIKRPINSECLGGYKPSYCVKSKVIRFDCLVLPR